MLFTYAETRKKSMKSTYFFIKKKSVFSQPLSGIRQFLSSISTGDDYQCLKKLYLDIIENNEEDDQTTTDFRINKPYLLFSMNQSTSKSYRIRQFLFNAATRNNMRPFCPMAILNRR